MTLLAACMPQKEPGRDSSTSFYRQLTETILSRQDEAVRWTPLQLAAHRGWLELCKELVEGGSEPNEQDNKKQTPLHFAAKAGKELVCQYLLSVGAELHTVDERGWNALHAAASTGRTNICIQLKEMGCSLESKTNDGLTPMLVAAKYGSSVLANYLVLLGSRPSPCIPGVMMILPRFHNVILGAAWIELIVAAWNSHRSDSANCWILLLPLDLIKSIAVRFLGRRQYDEEGKLVPICFGRAEL